jgi:DNA-binding SARP family transcriptional activator
VFCLGQLHVFQGDRDLGALPNRRAKSVFKYLLLHEGRPIPREQLMEMFWPDSSPSAARNSMNVAIHGLRRFLSRPGQGGGHIRFRDGAYLLDPNLDLWLDLTEFERQIVEGRRREDCGDHAGSLHALEAAEALYSGSLFEDDPYEDWTAAPRRAVEDRYIELLGMLAERYWARRNDEALVRVSRKIIAVQPASEIAHRQLMGCYARLGRRHLALRQFQDCASALFSELDVTPAPETVELYERIRGRRAVDGAVSTDPGAHQRG